MPALEQLVRPFQLPNFINDKKVRVTRVIKVPTARAIITWGSPGDSPETKQVGLNVTIKGDDVKKAYKEKDRETTDIQVTNPDDPSQSVTVRRIDKIRFTRPKPFSDNKTGQPTDTPPGNQKPSGGALVSPSGTNSSGNVPAVISGPGFADGKDGITLSKTDNAGSSTPVNGNPNVTTVPTAGIVIAESRNEVNTFVLKWDDTGAGA